MRQSLVRGKVRKTLRTGHMEKQEMEVEWKLETEI